MQLLRQSTAIDLPIGPFVDQTDGFTAETGLTLTQPDIRLKKGGAAWAQKNAAQTLSHEENGYYEVSLDTTDTNTLGPMTLAVNESGALPVWHEFLVVPADVYDALVNGTGNGIRADAVGISGDTVAADRLETMLDGTGGNTLSLGQLNIVNSAGSAIVASSTGGNGHGIAASGNGSGEGISSTGGATGHGIQAIGGATSGNGIRAEGTAGNGRGISAVGGASDGPGAEILGTGSGQGLVISAGGSGGTGVLITGGGSNNGITTTGGPSGGHGFHAIGGGSGASGIVGAGNGAGHGMLLLGGATGHGIRSLGGATSGDGISAEGNGSGDGISATATSGNHGINATGQGAGDGLRANGGATGQGIRAIGGATSGSGIRAEAQTSGNGITASGVGAGGAHGIDASGNGSGAGIQATGGATGHGLLGLGGSTSGDGIRGVAQTSGDGIEGVGAGGGRDLNVDQLPAALVGGRMDSSVGAMAANTLTASALAADAVTEIQASILSDATPFAGANVNATISSRATQASVDIIDDFVDTEVAAIKAKTDNLPEGITKNAALGNFEFFMADSADHVTGKTGLTVTAERSIDGGAFAACANSPAEVSAGVYKINLDAGDLNGDVITFKFTAAGADATLVTIKTEA